MNRFSLNQATTKRWPLADLVAGCVAAGVPAVGLWREEVAEFGLDKAAALVRDAGLTVSSLCRGGFFHSEDWYDDNRRAIEEAATLGTDTLVLVSGGLPGKSRDLDGARRHVADAIGALVPDAQAAGVRLAIEPLHPMFCSDRCVVATLGRALEIAAPFPADAVGVCLDTYHLWWDDQVWRHIDEAGLKPDPSVPYGARIHPLNLFISGYSSEAVPPGSAFLAKPFDHAALLAEVRELLDAPIKSEP